MDRTQNHLWDPLKGNLTVAPKTQLLIHQTNHIHTRALSISINNLSLSQVNHRCHFREVQSENQGKLQSCILLGYCAVKWQVAWLWESIHRIALKESLCIKR